MAHKTNRSAACPLSTRPPSPKVESGPRPSGNYLEALEAHKPKRGRKRTPDSIKKRLATIDAELASADPLKRLQLIQERLDLTTELAAWSDKVDLSALEKELRRRAPRPTASRKGISYAAWRELGVDAAVLKAAGISRAS